MSMVNPAAVPMPGPMSNRSDLPPSQGAMRLPNPEYGEQQQFLADPDKRASYQQLKQELSQGKLLAYEAITAFLVGA